MTLEKYWARYMAVVSFIGGAIWIRSGMELALLPARVPGISYRSSNLYMPWFGLGLLFIGFGVWGYYLSIEKSKRRAARWPLAIVLIGSGLYCTGTIIRLWTVGAWEPAQPVGFLLTIAGLFCFSGITLRRGRLPRWCGTTLLFSGIVLLLFNDQTVMAWSSVPFGGIWVGLSLYLWWSYRGLKSKA